jgi:hypothetical protein
MRNYWTCSKFADWLRGTAKPKWGTGDDWKKWKINAKATHPIRWWIAEEGLDYLQDVYMYVPDKIRSVRYYINNRFITRSHALTAHRRDIRPGSWCDVGDRFLPCLFNELVDFVEIETAWMNVIWDEKASKKYKTSWLRRQGWRTWRSRDAGLAHLDWAASLTHSDEWISKDDPIYGTPTRQAIQAKEIKTLYLWWTEVYPNRPDPYDVSGWSAYCDEKRKRGIDVLETDPLENKEESRRLLNTLHDLEAKYEAEDEEMLIRLIKVRNGLWT